MQFYNGTACLVLLVGTLVSMPETQHASTEHYIFVNRKRICLKNNVDKQESYRVILSHHDMQRIQKFGFPGMLLTIQGDLRTELSAEIIAEKIEFMDFPSANQHQTLSNTFSFDEFKSLEKGYWFSKTGSLRNELTYMH